MGSELHGEEGASDPFAAAAPGGDCRAWRARALYLFVSTRRDEARPDGDVDLVIDYAEGFSLLDLVALQEEIDRVVGARSDLTTRGGLHPRLRDDILRDAEQVL